MLTGPEQKILRKAFGDQLVSLLCTWQPEDEDKVCRAIYEPTTETWHAYIPLVYDPYTGPTLDILKGIGGAHDQLVVIGQIAKGRFVQAFTFTGPSGSLPQLLIAYGFNRRWLREQARARGPHIRLDDAIWAKYDPEFKYDR